MWGVVRGSSEPERGVEGVPLLSCGVWFCQKMRSVCPLWCEGEPVEKLLRLCGPGCVAGMGCGAAVELLWSSSVTPGLSSCKAPTHPRAGPWGGCAGSSACGYQPVPGGLLPPEITSWEVLVQGCSELLCHCLCCPGSCCEPHV